MELMSGRSRRGQMIVALVMFALGAALLIAAGKPAHAANGVTIVVNDTSDATAGKVCPTVAPTDKCTLRQALVVANGDTNDVIHLPEIPSGSATVYKLSHANGPFVVTAPMTIAGDDDPRHAGTVTITGITIQNGIAPTGGGIINHRTPLVLGNDIIANNVADGNNAGGRGGGVANSDGTLTVLSTTFANNATTLDGTPNIGQGGGIYNNIDASPGPTMTIVNSTFNGNSAGQGGGIWTTNPASLNNDTIVGNTAVNSAVAVDIGGGGIYDASSNAASVVTLHNTIVSKNLTSSDCGPLPARFTSSGHNIDGDNSCHLTGAGDHPSTDPNVAALAFNAPPVIPPNGFPNTMAITTASPAFDKADNTNCPTADERGLSRPQGAACDVGAFEVLVVVPTLPKSGLLPSSSPAPQPAWLGLALLLVGALGAAALVARRA